MEHRRFTKNEISVRVMYEHIILVYFVFTCPKFVCILLALSKQDMPHASQIPESISVGANVLGCSYTATDVRLVLSYLF